MPKARDGTLKNPETKAPQPAKAKAHNVLDR